MQRDAEIVSNWQDFRAQCATEIRQGLQSSPNDSSKWSSLREHVAHSFSIAVEDVRVSQLNKSANLTNRLWKDVAWENPRVLVAVIDPNGEVTLDAAERKVREFADKYPRRHADLPWLRVALIFTGSTLASVMTLWQEDSFLSPSPSIPALENPELDPLLDHDGGADSDEE